jgi:hypothetical protein
VQANDADILLSGSLLGLDETGGAVNADNEAAGDLGVESAAVTSLLDSSIVVSLLCVRMVVASVPTSACA